MDEIREKLLNDYDFKIEDILNKAISIIKLNLTPLLFYTSIYLLINIFLMRFGYRGMVIQVLLSGPFIAGYYNAFRLHQFGIEPAITNYFIIFQNPIRYLLANIFIGLIAAAGLYLLIAPGIYFFIAYFFTLPFLINKPINIWTAMEASRIIITKKWFKFLGLILILMGINILGALLFGIGLLLSIPLTYASIHVVFYEIFPEITIEKQENDEDSDTSNFNMFR